MAEIKGRLDGKVAVVIGATSGIGAGIAKKYADEGAQTIIAAPGFAREGGEIVVKAITSKGGSAEFVISDVTDEDSVAALFKEVKTKYGRIDIMNFNSGVQDVVKPFHEQSLKEWDHVVNVNSRGCFLSMKHVLPYMMEQKHGSIINTGSMSATKVSFPYILSLYAMSKASVLSLTRAVAYEYGKYNIRANSISPGYVCTELLPIETFPKEELERTLSKIPLGRLGEIKDIANLSLFLASDDSEYLTGQNFLADGGQLIT